MARRGEIRYYDIATEFQYAYDSLLGRHREKVSGYRPSRFTLTSLLIEYAADPRKSSRLSQQDILDVLSLIRGMRLLLDSYEGRIGPLARRKGISYQRIAAALGLRTRQAAEQRVLRMEFADDVDENERIRERRQKRFGAAAEPSMFDDTLMAVTVDAYLSPNRSAGRAVSGGRHEDSQQERRSR